MSDQSTLAIMMMIHVRNAMEAGRSFTFVNAALLNVTLTGLSD